MENKHTKTKKEESRFIGVLGINIFGGFLIMAAMDNNYMGAAVSGICLTNSITELVTGNPHYMYEYVGKKLVTGYKCARKRLARLDRSYAEG